MRAVFRNIGWLLGSRGVNAALSLVYLGLAARCLGLADFGRFSLMIVLAQAITGIATFNTWQAVVHWGGEGAGRTASAAGFAIALDCASIPVGIVLAAIACWSAPLWLPLPESLRLTAFALCCASLLAIRSTPTGILRLHDRYDLAAMAEAVLPATRALGAVIAALAQPGVAGFVAAWALAEAACAGTYWLAALRLQRLRLSDVSLRRLPREEVQAWRFVWGTNLSRSLAVTGKQVLILLVGTFGGAALAGGYRIASQLGLALVQLGEVVSRALYPELVKMRDRAQDLAARMALVSLMTGLTAVALAVIGGEYVIHFVAGPEFAFAYPVMVLLCLAGACDLAGASWDSLLVSRGHAIMAFLCRAVPTIALLALLHRIVQHLGIAGVGMGVLAASALSVAALWFAAQHYRRASPQRCGMAVTEG